MRARAGDPPRTMPQKVLAGRTTDASQSDHVEVKVDQVVLTRAPGRALAEALALGMKKTSVEVAVAYDGICVSDASSCAALASGHYTSVPPETLSHGILIARPGVGFPAPVHLERLASPARLAVTDDPRLCAVGGIGMLTMVLPPAQLGRALAQGSVVLRAPRSVQVLLSGRLRPFVCARDITLELLRRGMAETIRKIDTQHGAPVVIEFAGPSARLLSVPDRAVLCGIAPAAGAAAALFISDEKSEVFLRDQRRSKAHRALAPDAGAPCDEVISIDLASVDPLAIDEHGQIKAVRDLAGMPIHQVILGGDNGATLRDMLAAASLLKSKRVPARLDLLVAPPSRQVLEVLAHSGALVDLVATGARMVEPDRRLLSGEIYTPAPGQSSLRTFDADPPARTAFRFIVASAETLAYAVATGHIGDPRSFKRPVRVTVPRVFPTDDVLIVRQRKSDAAAPKKEISPLATLSPGWNTTTTLDVVEGIPSDLDRLDRPVLLSLSGMDEIRHVAADPLAMAPNVRAVVASFVPSSVVSLLTGVGIAVFSIDASSAKALAAEQVVTLVPPSQWPSDGFVVLSTSRGKAKLRWLARGVERQWLVAGSSRAPAPSRPVSR